MTSPALPLEAGIDMNRKAHWERVYADKSPQEVGWYQSEPILSLLLVSHAGVGPSAPIIDVGGGASVLVDRLHEQGFRRLAVLDISGHALDHARQRLGQAAAAMEWYETDVTQFDPPHTYAVWHDRAVFHFLTDAQDRRRYVQSVNKALAPGGNLIVAAFALDGPDTCSGLKVVRYDTAGLGAELGSGFKLMETASEMHQTPSGGRQQFGFYRYVKSQAV